MKRMLTITSVVALFSLPQLAAARDWECKLVVKSGVAENAVTLGQKSDATGGIDGRYDVPALLRGAVQARFVEGGQGYWRDIKGTGAAQWQLLVDVNDTATPVTVGWNGCQLPDGVKATLAGAGELASSGAIVLGRGDRQYKMTILVE